MKKCFSFLKLFFFVLVLASASLFVLPKGVQAYGCGGPYPPVPQKFWAKSGPGNGEVTLYWEKAPYANRYAVEYGTKSNSYQYGGNNIGGENTTWYTVKSLAAGTTYYFRLAAARDCTSSGFTAEIRATAGGAMTYQTENVVSQGRVGVPAVSYQPVSMSGPVGKQHLWAKTGPRVGEATLYWQHADSADNYHLVYGTQPGKATYGALNIGKITSLTVRSLSPGTTYYFALVPVMNNQALYTTPWVRVAALAPSIEVVPVTASDLRMPVPSDPVLMEKSNPPALNDEDESNDDQQGEDNEQVEDVKGVSDEVEPGQYEEPEPYYGAEQEDFQDANYEEASQETQDQSNSDGEDSPVVDESTYD